MTQKVYFRQEQGSTQNQPQPSKLALFKSKAAKLVKPEKAKNLYRNPKIIIFITLIGTLVVLFIALRLLSVKETPEKPIIPLYPMPQQNTQNTINPNLAGIAQKVEDYSQQIKSLVDFTQEPQYPIVDLDINFDK